MTYKQRNPVIGCEEGCNFCDALMKMANRNQLCNFGGFLFNFTLDKLLWNKQVAIGEVRELYPVRMNDDTIFLIEKGKEDRITTASADRIAAITGVEWVYIYCDND